MSARLIEPNIVWDPDVGTTTVLCVCGAQMSMETGTEVDDRARAHQWAWWRCSEDSRHITRSIPLPIRLVPG